MSQVRGWTSKCVCAGLTSTVASDFAANLRRNQFFSFNDSMLGKTKQKNLTQCKLTDEPADLKDFPLLWSNTTPTQTKMLRFAGCRTFEEALLHLTRTIISAVNNSRYATAGLRNTFLCFLVWNVKNRNAAKVICGWTWWLSRLRVWYLNMLLIVGWVRKTQRYNNRDAKSVWLHRVASPRGNTELQTFYTQSFRCSLPSTTCSL